MGAWLGSYIGISSKCSHPTSFRPPCSLPRGETASRYSELRGKNSISQKGHLPLTTGWSGGRNGRQHRAIYLPAGSAAAFPLQPFPTVVIITSGGFVCLILLLVLKEAERAFLVHVNLALTCFSNFLMLTPCWVQGCCCSQNQNQALHIIKCRHPNP